LTGDALDAPLLADVVVTERNEPTPRRHLDPEEPAAATRAGLGAAAARGLRRRTRRHAWPASLRIADIAFRSFSFPCSCHRSCSCRVSLKFLSRRWFNDSTASDAGKVFFQPNSNSFSRRLRWSLSRSAPSPTRLVFLPFSMPRGPARLTDLQTFADDGWRCAEVIATAATIGCRALSRRVHQVDHLGRRALVRLFDLLACRFLISSVSAFS
jgi:hypothetical protein